MAAVLALFRDCSPAEEFFDYPLYFPAPIYRGVPPPMQSQGQGDTEKTDEELKQEEVDRAIQEALKKAPKVDVQKQKFNEISGGAPQISAQSAGDLSRVMGFAPSQADIASLYAEFGDNVNFDQFMKWNNTKCAPHKTMDTPDELAVFFRTFDPTGSGILSRQQVKTVLGSYGEALTDEEVDVIFKEMGIVGDTIDYNDFIRRLLAE